MTAEQPPWSADDPLEQKLAALEQIVDQRLLASIATNDKDRFVRRVAAERVDDQHLLATIATDDKDRFVRRVAVGQVEDQDLLATIATNAKDPTVRQAAAERIQGQDLLATIATNAKDPTVRQAAAERIQDLDLLATIATNDKDPTVRQAAAERIQPNNPLTTLAGKVAVDLSSGSDTSTRHRVEVDVGATADLVEIAQILTDLSKVAAASFAWARVERDLAAGDSGPGDGDVVVVTRTAVGLGDDPVRVESIVYRNPIEIILAGGAALGGLGALLTAARQWRLSKAEGEKLSAEARKLEAEARQLDADTERGEIENGLYKWLLANQDDFRASPEMVSQIIGEAPGALEALARLSMYSITVTELPAAAAGAGSAGDRSTPELDQA